MARHWIINQPGKVSRFRKSAWGLVTLVAWLLFVWLLIPVATLALWAFGATTAYSSAATVLPTIEPELLIMLALASLVMATSLLAWAEFNRFRFTGKERRSAIAPTTPHEIAQRYLVEPQVIEALQRGRSMSVRVNDAGWPDGVTERR